MLLCKSLARSQAAVSPFQRQKLEIAEEESKRTSKTMQGQLIVSTAFALFICVEVGCFVVDVCLIRIGAERGAVQERLSDPEGAESEQREGADTGGFAHVVSFWKITEHIYSSVVFKCSSERGHFM